MKQKEVIQKFCEILRKRSNDHKNAMHQISFIPSVAASILRMELDSMIRVIYLLSHRKIEDRIYLIDQTFAHKKWSQITKSGKEKKVTDKDMVDLASNLHGWAASVYKFGCSFIHLTEFHDYARNNPLDMIKKEDKSNILKHMRYYHGGPKSDNPSFEEFARYFPMVFNKISKNLECYIKDLERGLVDKIY